PRNNSLYSESETQFRSHDLTSRYSLVIGNVESIIRLLQLPVDLVSNSPENGLRIRPLIHLARAIFRRTYFPNANRETLYPVVMQNRITGTTMPVLEFLLEPNDAIISEAGELSWMSPNIQMTTHTQFAGGGGFFGAIKRMAGGGSLFMTEYRAIGSAAQLA